MFFALKDEMGFWPHTIATYMCFCSFVSLFYICINVFLSKKKTILLYRRHNRARYCLFVKTCLSCRIFYPSENELALATWSMYIQDLKCTFLLKCFQQFSILKLANAQFLTITGEFIFQTMCVLFFFQYSISRLRKRALFS